MQLKKYSFPFVVLDDDGNPQHQRLATDDDAAKVLADGEGPGSPSEHLHLLTKQEQDLHPSLKYRAALQRVQDRRPDLVRLHASESAGKLRVY